jgi:hypothetical protein
MKTIFNYHKNIIIYLGDRLRNLETGKKESDNTVKDRNYIIISFNN